MFRARQVVLPRDDEAPGLIGRPGRLAKARAERGEELAHVAAPRRRREHAVRPRRLDRGGAGGVDVERVRLDRRRAQRPEPLRPGHHVGGQDDQAPAPGLGGRAVWQALRSDSGEGAVDGQPVDHQALEAGARARQRDAADQGQPRDDGGRRERGRRARVGGHDQEQAVAAVGRGRARCQTDSSRRRWRSGAGSGSSTPPRRSDSRASESDGGARPRLGEVGARARLTDHLAQELGGHRVKPVRVLRSVGQPRVERPAALGPPRPKHQGIVGELDAAGSADELGPVPALVGRPREQDIGASGGEGEVHRRGVLDGPLPVPARLETGAHRDAAPRRPTGGGDSSRATRGR